MHIAIWVWDAWTSNSFLLPKLCTKYLAFLMQTTLHYPIIYSSCRYFSKFSYFFFSPSLYQYIFFLVGPNIAEFFSHNTLNIQAHVEFYNISMASPWDNINFALFVLKDHLASSCFDLGLGLFLGRVGDIAFSSVPKKKRGQVHAQHTECRMSTAREASRSVGARLQGEKQCQVMSLAGPQKQYVWRAKTI